MSLELIEPTNSKAIGHLNRNRLKIREPHIVGTGKDLPEALKDAQTKIQKFAQRGNYQCAIIKDVIPVRNGSLIYVYPSVSLYRIK